MHCPSPTEDTRCRAHASPFGLVIVPSIHALPVEAQKGAWALVSEVRGRLRTGLVPAGGFRIGFLDGLTATEPVPHTVIHAIPRRAGDHVALPECSEWVHDDGVLP